MAKDIPDKKKLLCAPLQEKERRAENSRMLGEWFFGACRLSPVACIDVLYLLRLGSNVGMKFVPPYLTVLCFFMSHNFPLVAAYN